MLDARGLLGEVLQSRGAGSLVVWRGDACARAHQGTRGDPPRFPVYSIAKTVIATLALRLAEERQLDLDAPLATWHPAAILRMPDASRGEQLRQQLVADLRQVTT